MTAVTHQINFYICQAAINTLVAETGCDETGAKNRLVDAYLHYGYRMEDLEEKWLVIYADGDIDLITDSVIEFSIKGERRIGLGRLPIKAQTLFIPPAGIVKT